MREHIFAILGIPLYPPPLSAQHTHKQIVQSSENFTDAYAIIMKVKGIKGAHTESVINLFPEFFAFCVCLLPFHLLVLLFLLLLVYDTVRKPFDGFA